MSDVSFNEEQNYTPQSYGSAPQGTGLGALVIKWGFAKDMKGAQIVLAVIAGVAVITTIIIVFTLLTPKKYGPPPGVVPLPPSTIPQANVPTAR